MKTKLFLIALLICLAFVKTFASPSITTSDSTITFPYTLIGATSPQKMYTVSAKDLKENLLIMAPLGYKVSLTSNMDFASSVTLTPQNGVIAQTTVYIKYMPKSKDCNNGIITLTSLPIAKAIKVQAPIYYSLKFRLSSGAYSDETVVRFFDPAKLEFDPNYDAAKMMNSGNTPSMFTKIQNVAYAINSCPSSFVKNISMCLNTGVAFRGIYKLEIIGLESFDPSISIYIQDRETGRVYNYRDALSYDISISPNSPDRFNLFFLDNNNTMTLNDNSVNIVTGLEELSSEENLISVREGQISIDRTQILPLNAMRLEIYNMSGQRVFVKENIESNEEQAYQVETAGLTSGLYIVNAIYNNKTVQRKAYLN
jgi:hypothetical protein